MKDNKTLNVAFEDHQSSNFEFDIRSKKPFLVDVDEFDKINN